MTTCAHSWAASQSNSGFFCTMCDATIGYTELLEAHNEDLGMVQRAVASPKPSVHDRAKLTMDRLEKQIGVDGWKPEPKPVVLLPVEYKPVVLHKPSIVCARKGCESCLEAAERIYAQLASHA